MAEKSRIMSLGECRAFVKAAAHSYRGQKPRLRVHRMASSRSRQISNAFYTVLSQIPFSVRHDFASQTSFLVTYSLCPTRLCFPDISSHYILFPYRSNYASFVRLLADRPLSDAFSFRKQKKVGTYTSFSLPDTTLLPRHPSVVFVFASQTSFFSDTSSLRRHLSFRHHLSSQISLCETSFAFPN